MSFFSSKFMFYLRTELRVHVHPNLIREFMFYNHILQRTAAFSRGKNLIQDLIELAIEFCVFVCYAETVLFLSFPSLQLFLIW